MKIFMSYYIEGIHNALLQCRHLQCITIMEGYTMNHCSRKDLLFITTIILNVFLQQNIAI